MAKHVLVIDDQESMRSIISQMLRDKGYIVTTATDGETGLNLFNENPASLDLILADVNMPKIDGFEFLKRVKEKLPKLPVVFITGVNEQVAEAVGAIYKVDGIIKKPFQVDTALKIIEKFLT